MLKPTSEVVVAIKVVQTLKANQKRMKASDLATSVGTSTFFVEQVARKLRRAGIVASHKGPGGGHSAVDGTVNGYQILTAMQGDQKVPADALTRSIMDNVINTYKNVVIS